MAGISEMTAMYENIMKALPFDNKLFEETLKKNAGLNEKFASVLITAADKNTDISSKWTKDTLTRLSGLAKPQEETADYAKSMTDFASDQVEVVSESMAAFAETAKKAQMDFVEIMMTFGKDLSEEAAATVKKTTSDVSGLAKKQSVK